MTFLATTASITPFIGLFGTVWGIMTAFMNIGAQGSTDLVGGQPPIAEALIATALGLFAAIPAVYFYNHFTSKVKVLRVGDGRLRAGVPEHLGKELHLVPKVLPQPDANARAPARPPRHDLAVGDQRHPARGRDAGAADHLHGGGTDDAEGRRGEPAGCAAGRQDDRASRMYITVPLSYRTRSAGVHRQGRGPDRRCWPERMRQVMSDARIRRRSTCAATAACNCRN